MESKCGILLALLLENLLDSLPEYYWKISVEHSQAFRIVSR